MTKQLIALVLISFVVIVTCNGQIFINEWMASNSSVIEDPDFEETGDWIELYNSSSSELDLSGHYLTDDLANPTKWTLPALNIEPQTYLLIWADGLDQGLHANFKLTKDGEAIGLYNSDTILIDKVEFQHQKTNVSMGRRRDGGVDLGFFTEPTPGSGNAQRSYEQITFYEPRFSIKGGFYEGPLEVELSTIAGDIYYTLDGSVPQTNDLLYTGPIEISSTTILRAATIISDQLPGKAITHSYFVNNNLEDRGLPVISIVSEPDYFWDKDIGLYVQDFKPPWRYPINIELFENDGSDRAAINELAGTKVNGLNSWILPQKMLGIYFDNDYDNNNLDYQLFFDRDRKRYDNFILRASGNDWSNSLFRDALAQDLTVENMDVEHMGYRPAIAFINGEYMGIHNLRSRIDEGFIEDNFGYKGSEYDLIENDGVVEQGDTVAYAELRALFYQDLSVASNYNKLAEVIDVQNFIDYFIAEIWAANSSYGHNIQLWKPKQSGSKWRWIFTDLDRGLSWSDQIGLEYFTDTAPGYYDFVISMLSNVLKNEAFRTQFIARFADHMYTTFNPSMVKKKVDVFAERLSHEIPYHVDKWKGTTSPYGNGISSVKYWENQVSEIKHFALDRETFILEELRGTYGLAEPAILSSHSYPPAAGSITINDILIPDSPWKGFYFQDLPIELTSVAKEGNTFLGWTTGTKETIVPKGSSWLYLDNGSDPGQNWNKLFYNASNWKISKAQFGYGDSDETTIVDSGDIENKHITTYFRRFIEVDCADKKISSLEFDLLRDDGAVVHLNGVEIHRSNMPTGEINYLTTAARVAAGEEENVFYGFSINPDLLKEGTNLIAVEIHQENPGSSDISFDMELGMTLVSDGPMLGTDDDLMIALSKDSILIANYEVSSSCILEGLIEEDKILEKECSPYFITTDVVVAEGISLSIEPGVELHFSESTDLLVHGSLDVIGTETQPVVFKASARADNWGGVVFKNTTDTSRIAWLELSGATRGDHPIYSNAAISAFHAVVEMDHLTIEEVLSNPILAYYSDVKLQNSYLHSAVTGDLINIKYGKGLVHNCEFRGNEQVDTDAIDYDEVEGGVISNNKIYDFLGFNSDGIDLGERSKDILVENNFIYNCTDKAISVGQESTVMIKDNIIVNCNQGVAVKDLSLAEINSNTFYNVGIPIACFEKTVGIGGGLAMASNCILSNSPIAPFIVDEHSSLDLANMLSDTDTLMMSDGLTGHPHFVDPTYFDFQLMANSDAKDAGVDESGTPIDLGTNYHVYNAEPGIMITAINYNPALNADAEFIDIYNPSAQDISLTGYVLSSAIDLVFPELTIEAGETIRLVKDASLFPNATERLVQWDFGKLSNKGEQIRLMDPYGIIVDQVVYDDKAPWPTAADGEGRYLRLRSYSLDNHFAESWEEGKLTSIEETAETGTFSLGPNPAKEQLLLSAQSVELEQVAIVSREGRIIRQLNPNSKNQLKIDIQDLAVGLYYLHINGQTALPFIKVR